MNQPLKVLFLAAEAAPFAQVGGLAEVATSLTQALRRLDVDVRLMMPRYGSIRSRDYDFQRVGNSIAVPVGPEEEHVHLLETHLGELPVYLIWDDQYFSAREKIYGFNDDPQRFTFFSRAVIASLAALDWQPDVIHANDWHTAPVVVWLDVYGRALPAYRDIATLFTLHNLAYQGVCGRLILTFARMDKVKHLPVEPPGQVNWMAQGIAHADLLNTTSPTYARNILTPERGRGLESLLTERQERLFGILNGINIDFWNPETDEALTQTYNRDSLRMREVNKAALQREMGLAARPKTPLLGFVGRVEALKGLEILIESLEALLAEAEFQFVLLGTGDPLLEQALRELQARYPAAIRVYLKFDPRLARRIYGGADIFVMPSESEPCGLGQMLAMRYGAVPVVRATGGLVDTVVDVTTAPQRGTGFAFEDYTAAALTVALRRALLVYGDEAAWRAIQKRGMEVDFSWDASARAYLDLYRRAQALHDR